MTPAAISADGKSHGKLCSLAIDLNASKQIAPQAAASAGVPCRRITLIASPLLALQSALRTRTPRTAHARVSARSCPRRSIGGLSRSGRRLEERNHNADARRKRAGDEGRTGQADGRCVAAVLDSGLDVARTAGGGLPAGARAAARREARRLSRQPGTHRAGRRVLSSSPRLAVVRAQRGFR